MKKIILIFGVFIYTLISNAQVAGALLISDTRSINDTPNFIEHSIRADFKERNIIGVPGNGLYSTNLTIAQWEDTDNSGGANHQLNFNDGGVFYRNAYPLDSQWGKWQQLLMTNIDGNVGIGVLNPLNKLDVNGTIHSKEVKVDMNGWSDFVFKKEYNLPTLEQVEKHIIEKGHLENIPSEKEVLKDGINLGEMNAKLLRKIEELTLYMIEMRKEMELLKRNKK
ncbi:hypothetical protein AB9T89_19310 [Flavobacterium oncorhynchi]|uniref:hypothetical protein n=1 Tax=Flavobacterium oncorhynchi TaxID=728056 RepID=UPI00351A06A5